MRISATQRDEALCASFANELYLCTGQTCLYFLMKLEHPIGMSCVSMAIVGEEDQQ